MAYHVLITYRSAAAYDPALQLYRRLSEDGCAPYLDTQGAYVCDSGRLQSKVDECTDILFVAAPGTFEESSEDDGFSVAAAYAQYKGKNLVTVTLPGFSWSDNASPAALALQGGAVVDASARSADELYIAVCGALRSKAKKTVVSEAKGNGKRILLIALAVLLVLALGAGILMLKSGRQKDTQPSDSGSFVPEVTLVPTASTTQAPTAVPTEVPTAVPTSAPTTVPTAMPTEVPTVVPTAVPTAVPAAVPTEAPAEVTIVVFTPVPTEVPAVVLTPVPAEIPTSVPEAAATPVPAPLARGTELEFGWYGDAPIRWTVLDSDADATRLISQECIACRPYGSSTDWYTSSLRIWLNHHFAWDVFNEAEINAMHYTEDDLVRIPTVADMTNPDYGFSTDPDRTDASRGAKAGRTAKQQGVWVNKDNGRCSYFTMTPNNSSSMKQIRSDGRVGFASVDRDNVGVRIIIRVSTGYLQ